jgi:hypothetical protein
MNILRNRVRVLKDSPAHLVSLDWRKTILVASRFFFVFTQPRSRATDLRCSRDVRCSPISDRTAALHRVTLRANCRLIHRSKSVRRTTSSRCPFRPPWAQAVRQFFLVDAAIRLAWCRNLRSPLPSPSHGRRPSRAPSARSLGFPVWRHRP